MHTDDLLVTRRDQKKRWQSFPIIANFLTWLFSSLHTFAAHSLRIKFLLLTYLASQRRLRMLLSGYPSHFSLLPSLNLS